MTAFASPRARLCEFSEKMEDYQGIALILPQIQI
jgi:hypothetical protein